MGGEQIPIRVSPPAPGSHQQAKDYVPSGAVITLTSQQEAELESADISVDGHQTHYKQEHVTQHQNLPPNQRIFEQQVQSDATSVVIGDSVISNMKGAKMVMYPGEKVQVISVSGLQTAHLTEWCRKTPKSPCVTLLSVHVGINDCKVKEVTSHLWENLIRSCKRAFPKAKLQVSSILPAGQRCNSPLNNVITRSNASLCHVAKQMGATFVDNLKLFQSPKGLPRKALYRQVRGHIDPIHPSHVGTRRLAGNIKYGGVDCHHNGDNPRADSRLHGDNRQLYSDVTAGRTTTNQPQELLASTNNSQQQPSGNEQCSDHRCTQGTPISATEWTQVSHSQQNLVHPQVLRPPAQQGTPVSASEWTHVSHSQQNLLHPSQFHPPPQLGAPISADEWSLHQPPSQLNMAYPQSPGLHHQPQLGPVWSSDGSVPAANGFYNFNTPLPYALNYSVPVFQGGNRHHANSECVF